ncbi:unnamed protein product [Thelazia callipaeda]|uniref:Fukutin n=1 Tax=Thelazia callipaeda TaxID=103827 RepID=A0A0N5CVC7_THECL|nr:unnamed protein product [Thelazia callipaeda]
MYYLNNIPPDKIQSVQHYTTNHSIIGEKKPTNCTAIIPLAYTPSAQELEYLKQFNYLLWIGDAFANKWIFGTYDDGENLSPFDHLIFYRMEYSLTDNYVIFFGKNEQRAIQGLKTKKVYMFDREIWVPEDKKEFIFKWKDGRFLNCLKMNVTSTVDSRAIPENFIDKVAKFRDFIESHNSTPILFGGTLLGWYRECSFIMDTTDVDLAMKIDALNPIMMKNLEKTKEFKLYWILGKINDSLELSVYSNNIKIDLFFLYENADSAWVGGLFVSKRKKLQWIYPPILEFCVGELLGKLFHVPCNVEEVLQADYGEWKVPHATANFTWYESHKNIREAGYWSKQEWKDVYRTF